MLPALDIDKLSTLTKQEVRTLIATLESMAKECDPIDIPVKNYFSEGVYAREIFIPAGSFVIGKIHRYRNLNILSQGEMSLLSIEGCARIKGPFTVVSPPGVKRAAYAHTDCIWTTIHGTDETDLEKIEDEFIVKSYQELEEKEGAWLGSL